MPKVPIEEEEGEEQQHGVFMRRRQPLQISVMPGLIGDEETAGAGMLKKVEIIPPSSPNVAAAIKRATAWMQERGTREPQPVLQKNIEIMMRGGPMAEAIAKNILKTFQPHPSEALPSPSKVIEGD